MNTDTRTRVPEIAVLQAGRAFAALAVVVHHATLSAKDFGGGMPPWLERILDAGYFGVDFFFVLSGFIIFYTNRGRTEQPGWSRRYLETRALRIYLPYLPVGIAVGLAYSFLPALSRSERSWDWLSSLTLLPTSGDTALSVAWTLRSELVFYAVFWLAFAIKRPLGLLGGWFLVVAAAAVFRWPLAGGMGYGFSILNLEFLFGIILAHVVAVDDRRLPSSVALLLSAACFGANVPLGPAAGGHSALVGLGFAFLLLVLIRGEQRGLLKIPAWLLLLGNASYAIYLVHSPLISIAGRVCQARAELSSWYVIVGVSLVASTAAGLAYHLGFELPALGRVRAWLGVHRGVRAASPTNQSA